MHPGLTIGPALTKEVNSTPSGYAKLMNGSIPGTIRLMMPTGDVRDVAQGHINALTCPNVHGRRFILIKESLWLED